MLFEQFFSESAAAELRRAMQRLGHITLVAKLKPYTAVAAGHAKFMLRVHDRGPAQ
jgi:hypothetical protein